MNNDFTNFSLKGNMRRTTGKTSFIIKISYVLKSKKLLLIQFSSSCMWVLREDVILWTNVTVGNIINSTVYAYFLRLWYVDMDKMYPPKFSSHKLKWWFQWQFNRTKLKIPFSWQKNTAEVVTCVDFNQKKGYRP